MNVVPACPILVSSTFAPDSGGLFVFNGRCVERVDYLPTHGLAVRGDTLYRLMALRVNEGAELLVYDRHGVIRYLRLDNVNDPHDVLPNEGGSVLCVSTLTNSIAEVDPFGRTTTFWKIDSARDSWHLNCLVRHNGRLYATAFGRFTDHRAWSSRDAERLGLLFDVESGEDIVTGLSRPHTPRFIDGAWTICDSGTRSIVRVKGDGVFDAIDVGGYARGMCVVGDFAYVGISRDRQDGVGRAQAEIVTVSRATWEVVDRTPVPTGEIYDLVPVSADLLEGVRAGFHVPSLRAGVENQIDMFRAAGTVPARLWAIGDPLPPEDCRIRIVAHPPESIVIGDVATVPCSIRNEGNAILVSAPPNPIVVCYRWFHGMEPIGQFGWLHTALSRALPPGERLDLNVQVAAPDVAGLFELRMTVLQQNVAWFDDIDPQNGFRADVRIFARTRGAY